MPSASSYLLHVSGFAKYPYQTESKRDKNGRRYFLEYLENFRRKIHARQCPRWPRGRGRAWPLGRAPYPREPPVKWLTLFFCRKKANFRKKSRRRFQANRSYGSPYIHETVRQSQGQRRNRERQRDRSNLGGALAPPTPWEPRTRGETLLPSREEVK